MPDTGGRFPLPYPNPADPAGDGAAAIQALAEAQKYANGLIIGASISVSSGFGTVMIPYGVTYGDLPTVFVTHQPLVAGSTGASTVDLRVNEVYEDEVEVLAIDDSGSSFTMGCAVWVIPPPV